MPSLLDWEILKKEEFLSAGLIYIRVYDIRLDQKQKLLNNKVQHSKGETCNFWPASEDRSLVLALGRTQDVILYNGSQTWPVTRNGSSLFKKTDFLALLWDSDSLSLESVLKMFAFDSDDETDLGTTNLLYTLSSG